MQSNSLHQGRKIKGCPICTFPPSQASPEGSYSTLGPEGKGEGPAPAGRGLAGWHSCPSRPRGRAPALGGYLSLRHVRRLPRSPQDLTPHNHYQHREGEQQGEPRRPGDLQESSETYSFLTACASRRGDVTGPGVRGGQAAGRGTAWPPWLRPQRASRRHAPFSGLRLRGGALGAVAEGPVWPPPGTVWRSGRVRRDLIKRASL